jgi:uncharacterized protein YkwD
MEDATVPAKTLFTRILPVAAVTAGMLFAAPVADAGKKKTKVVKATIALGDKRKPGKARTSAAKKAKAKTASITCQNTTLLPAVDNLELVRAAILCLHNQIRAEKGLSTLRDNAKLRKAALAHSATMVEEGYFDHTSPSGATFVDRILSAKYTKRNDAWTLGENLAWGTGDLSTPAGIMQSWMASPGHKANILKSAYREVGIGIRLGVPSDNGVGATISAEFGAKL